MKVTFPFHYILILFIGFQAVSGLLGGICLSIRPDGSLLQMPLSMLDGSPFHNYLIPGLTLLILLGIVPTISFWGLIAYKPSYTSPGIFSLYHDQHWSWTYALYTGIMMVIWIDTQIAMLGYLHLVQSVYAYLGISIIMMALLPAVKIKYTLVHKQSRCS